jgi:phosphorylcholine metabolism protein LicD
MKQFKYLKSLISHFIYLLKSYSRISIRSDDQLSLQAEVLSDIVKIFNKLELPPLVTDGLVLGYIRENDFIRWDPDVDFFVELPRAQEKNNELLAELNKFGFKIRTINSAASTWKIRAFKHNFNVEIRAWVKSSEFWQRQDLVGRKYMIPVEFFTNTTKAQIRGVAFLIPLNTSKYLEYLYGDWKIPVKSNNYDKFTNRKFRS